MKNKFLSLLEAFVYYSIYLISGIAGSIVSIIMTSVIIGFEYLSNNMLANNEEFFEDVTEIVRNDISLGLFSSLLFVFIVYFFALKNKKGGLLGFAGMRKSNVASIIFSALCGIFSYFSVTSVLGMLEVKTETIQQYNEHMSWIGNGNAIVVILVVALLAPIVEEIVFRGVLISALQKVITPVGALVVTSLLFASAHGNIVQGAYSFVLGVILAYIRIHSGNLWNSITAHMFFNCSNYIFPIIGINSIGGLWSIFFLCIFAFLASVPRQCNK